MAAPPGLASDLHVFFALMGMLASSAGLGVLLAGSDTRWVRRFALLATLFIWLSWISSAPVYMYEYGVDKAVIKSYEELRAAHSIGMETKEHIFYTGLMLSTALGLIAYVLDPLDPFSRRLYLAIFIIIIVGGILLDALGAWIGISAKLGWYYGGGGG